jgi:hypothetical protein
MAFIGKIVQLGAVPSGLTLKSKGIKPSVQVDLVESIKLLKPGEQLVLTQAEIEAKAGKALPKHFRVNTRKKLRDVLGKDAVEMLEYVNDTGNSTFVFTLMGAQPKTEPGPEAQ